MGVDVRAHLDFFDFDDLLLLARLGSLLLVGIFQLAQIEDLAHRRFDIGGNFDEIEAGFFRHFQSLVGGHDADILSISPDQLNFGNADFTVRARSVLHGRIGFKRSANGRILLALFSERCSIALPIRGTNVSRHRCNGVNIIL